MGLAVILNVGWDSTLLDTRRMILQASGHIVESAHSVEEAIDRFRGLLRAEVSSLREENIALRARLAMVRPFAQEALDHNRRPAGKARELATPLRNSALAS